MSPESFDLAKIWMLKAESDLATAKLLIKGGERHLDTGSYHCQQAAEKALKAWLTAVEVVFTKTHSLELLVRLCIQTEPGFQRFLSHGIALTPYATEFRYPGGQLEPSQEDASDALFLAEEITFWISELFLNLSIPSSGSE